LYSVYCTSWERLESNIHYNDVFWCGDPLSRRDEASYLAGACVTSPTLSNVGGLLDNTIAENKYSTYTLIVPLYCSGD
jgi:hypothetical protein